LWLFFFWFMGGLWFFLGGYWGACVFFFFFFCWWWLLACFFWCFLSPKTPSPLCEAPSLFNTSSQFFFIVHLISLPPRLFLLLPWTTPVHLRVLAPTRPERFGSIPSWTVIPLFFFSTGSHLPLPLKFPFLFLLSIVPDMPLSASTISSAPLRCALLSLSPEISLNGEQQFKRLSQERFIP